MNDENIFRWCVGIACIILLALIVVFVSTFDTLGYMFAIILTIVLLLIVGGIKINNR